MLAFCASIHAVTIILVSCSSVCGRGQNSCEWAACCNVDMCAASTFVTQVTGGCQALSDNNPLSTLADFSRLTKLHNTTESVPTEAAVHAGCLQRISSWRKDACCLVVGPS